MIFTDEGFVGAINDFRRSLLMNLENAVVIFQWLRKSTCRHRDILP